MYFLLSKIRFKFENQIRNIMDLTKINKLNLLKQFPLYKYLPSHHLGNFLKNGEILFRNLTYFKEYEDAKKRGDKKEGGIYNNPTDGFEIKNITQNTEFKANHTINCINSDDVFVFCLSKNHDKKLYKEFESDCCVEITNVHEFTKKLGRSLKSMEYEYDNTRCAFVRKFVNSSVPQYCGMYRE